MRSAALVACVALVAAFAPVEADSGAVSPFWAQSMCARANLGGHGGAHAGTAGADAAGGGVGAPLPAVQWFDRAVIDHSLPPSPENTFSQRFVVNSSFAVPSLQRETPTRISATSKSSGMAGGVDSAVVNGTSSGKQPLVFLLVGGEMSLESWWSVLSSQAVRLAEEFPAHIVAVEHRFFGLSLPKPDLSDSNLADGHLSIGAAVDDLATFRSFIVPQLVGADAASDARVVLLGCSYSGVLASYARMRYPDLFTAVVASSPALNMSVSYPQYDVLMADSLESAGSPACRQTFLAAVSALQDMMQSGPAGMANVTSMFKSCHPLLTQDDSIAAVRDLVDIFVGFHIVQGDLPNDKIYRFCTALQYGSGATPLERFASLHRWSFGNACTPLTLGAYQNAVRVTEPDPTGVAWARQYQYLKCTQMGWFHACGNGDVACPFVDVSVSTEWLMNVTCSQIFGNVGTLADIQAAANALHTEFGGAVDPKGSRIIIVNGENDPFRMLSVTSPSVAGPNNSVVLISNGSHCSNTNSPSSFDQHAVIEAREAVVRQLGKWLD